jgi:hypothetical protein
MGVCVNVWWMSGAYQWVPVDVWIRGGINGWVCGCVVDEWCGSMGTGG